MKSPAFQFYPTDHLGSQRVQMMSLEEEGAHIRLLCYCWQHGSIPSDPELAARLVGKGCSVELATKVLTRFDVPRGEGRVTHDRIEAERAKQAEWKEKSSVGGKRSAELRKGGSRVVDKWLQPNGNTPSPTPTPSPSPKKGKGATALPYFVPKFPYPKSEPEMYQTLEREGVYIDPSQDGNFFQNMEKVGWRIRGKPIFDWKAMYQSRMQLIKQKQNGQIKAA